MCKLGLYVLGRGSAKWLGLERRARSDEGLEQHVRLDGGGGWLGIWLTGWAEIGRLNRRRREGVVFARNQKKGLEYMAGEVVAAQWNWRWDSRAKRQKAASASSGMAELHCKNHQSEQDGERSQDKGLAWNLMQSWSGRELTDDFPQEQCVVDEGKLHVLGGGNGWHLILACNRWSWDIVEDDRRGWRCAW
jgi:hypothetical protein